MSLTRSSEGSVADVFCLSFSVDSDFFGETVSHDLIPNGSNIPVTEDNRQQYVDMYTRFILKDSVLCQILAFVEGFRLIANMEGFLQHVNCYELERIVCGDPNMKIEDLQKVSKYEGGYAADTQIVQWFWDIVNEMDIKEQRLLLLFSTGTDRIPVGGVQNLEFVIQRASDDSDQLPTSHTCFNVLLLPEYSSKEKLKEKLLTAIRNCEGFGLV